MFKRLYNIDDGMQKEMFQVKALITFERYCRDQALWEEMKKCFHSKSTVSISWYKGSGAGFVEASEQSTNFAPHKINQIVVRTNQNKAVAECIASIQMRLELQGQLYDLTSYARLHYRLTKAEGVWYVLSLNGIYEKAGNPVYDDLPGIDRSELIEALYQERQKWLEEA